MMDAWRAFFYKTEEGIHVSALVGCFFSAIQCALLFLYQGKLKGPLDFAALRKYAEEIRGKDVFASWLCEHGTIELMGIFSSIEREESLSDHLDEVCRYAAYAIEDAVSTKDPEYVKETIATYVDEVYQVSSEVHIKESEPHGLEDVKDYHIEVEISALTDYSQGFSYEETLAC